MVLHVVASGTCAAVSGALAKLVFDDVGSFDWDLLSWGSVWKVGLFGAMLWSNGCMLDQFMKAQKQLGVVLGTVGNTMVNIIVTGLLGNIFFQEPIGYKWTAGCFSLMLGLFLMYQGTEKKHPKVADE